MTVHLIVRSGPHEGLDGRETTRRARVMMRTIKRPKDELSILLTSEEEVRELNKVHRQKDRPTDVLAFAMNEGEFSAVSTGLLGDVVISVPTARRQARARGVLLLDEVTLLLAHGLLHLVGWDHRTPTTDEAMRAETERLVRAASGTRLGKGDSAGRRKP